jgi:hypothetical protein
MELLPVIACVLGMVYAAAMILALRDRVSPRNAQAPRNINPRLQRAFFPIVLLIWAFALAVWLIVYGPVWLWRRLSA